MSKGIESVVIELQRKGILPSGTFALHRREHPFSVIHRVEMEREAFYFKQLKPRHNNSCEKLRARLTGEFEALKKVRETVAPKSCFSTPEPVYCSERDLLLVTRELKGVSVLDLGRLFASRSKAEAGSHSLAVYEKAGEFLKVLHQADTSPFTGEDLRMLVQYIAKRLMTPHFTDKEKRKIAGYLEHAERRISQCISSYHKCAIHRDYSPGNILSHGSALNVLDFGDATVGSPFEDLIVFKTMIERQLENRVKYRRGAVGELVRSFGKGYGIDFGSVQDPLFDMYTLRCYAIFMATFRKPWLLSYQSKPAPKEMAVNLFEFSKFKRKVLELCSV